MSDMITRLRAISNAAGQDAAEGLSDRSALAAMEARVTRGVRRRRVRAGVATLSVAAVAAVGTVVVPDLLDHAKVQLIDPGSHSVVRTDGAVTTFGDGSMSVVLGSGRVIDVVPTDEDSTGARALSIKEGCSLTEATLSPQGFETPRREYLNMVSFGSVGLIDDGGEFTPLFGGTSVTFTTPHPRLAFQVQAESGVAPNLVIVLSLAEARDGKVLYVGSRVSASPTVQYVGDSGAATQGAVVTSRSFDPRDLSYCYDTPLEKDMIGESSDSDVEMYVIADVWLTDRAGSSARIGTFTEVYQIQEATS